MFVQDAPRKWGNHFLGDKHSSFRQSKNQLKKNPNSPLNKYVSGKCFPRQNISKCLTCKKASPPFVKSCQLERAAQRRLGARIPVPVLVPGESPPHPSGLTSHLKNFDHTTKLYLCSNHSQRDSKFLYWESLYRAFSLTWPPVMPLYWNKWKLRFSH